MNAPTIIGSQDQLPASKAEDSWRASATCQGHHPNKSVFTSAGGKTELEALKGLLFNEQVLTGITARGGTVVCSPQYEMKFFPAVVESDAAIQQEVHGSPIYGKIMCETKDEAVRAGTAQWSLNLAPVDIIAKIHGCWIADDENLQEPSKYGAPLHIDYVFLAPGFALDIMGVSENGNNNAWYTFGHEGTD